MAQRNLSSGNQPIISKTSNLNQNSSTKVSIKARSSTKKSAVGVTNLTTSVRSSKKTTDNKKKTPRFTAHAEIKTSDKAVQVDEIEIMASNCDTGDGDGPNVIFPSAQVLQEIERNKKLKKEQDLKARLGETRKFEEHSEQHEIHLTNLKEFMDRGAITRKQLVVRKPSEESRVLLEKTLKPVSDRVKTALGAYDRIKMKEEELLKMFSSI